MIEFLCLWAGLGCCACAALAVGWVFFDIVARRPREPDAPRTLPPGFTLGARVIPGEVSPEFREKLRQAGGR